MSLSSDEGEGERDGETERGRENGSVHFKVNQYPW